MQNFVHKITLSLLAAIPKTGPVNTIAVGAGAAVGVVATILICAVIILTACVLKHRIFRICNTIFIAVSMVIVTQWHCMYIHPLFILLIICLCVYYSWN